MKKIPFIFLFFILISTAQSAGPLLWGPNNTSNSLQPNLSFQNDLIEIQTGSLNPSVTPVKAPQGSLYIASDGTAYQKQDAGLTNNWGIIPTTGIAWDSPGTIGSSVPNTGAFTSLKTTGTSAGGQIPFTNGSNNLISDPSLSYDGFATLSIIQSGTPSIVLNDTSGSNPGNGQIEWLHGGVNDFTLFSGQGGYLTLQDNSNGKNMIAWDSSDNVTFPDDLSASGNLNVANGTGAGGAFRIYGSGGTLNFSSNAIEWLSYNQGNTTLDISANVIFDSGTISFDGGDITTDGNGNLILNNGGTQTSESISITTQNTPSISLKYASGTGYSDIQSQDNVGAVIDTYNGPNAPHGGGRWTIWDDKTSAAILDSDHSDNITAGANVIAVGSLTTNLGIIVNTPQANGSTPGITTDGAMAVTTGSGPTFTHILCIYNNQAAIPGWFRASDGTTPCTF